MFGYGKKRRAAAAQETDQTPVVQQPLPTSVSGSDESVPEDGERRRREDIPGLLRRSETSQQPQVDDAERILAASPPKPKRPARSLPADAEPPPDQSKRPRFARLKQRLERTREILNTDVADLIQARKTIDEDRLEALETQPLTADVGAPSLPADAEPPPDQPKRPRLARLKQRLERTREILNTDVADLIQTRKTIDDDLLEELETQLLTADVGVPATSRVIDALHYRVKKREVKDPQALLRIMAAELRGLLADSMGPVAQPAPDRPQVILMVGVNGVGKTTTIGKLAKQLQEEGNSVMLAAGDTFRAAAVEQLQVWGERNGVPVIAQHANADSASVIFDALQAATARGTDVLIADTAGRLHTKANLMEELKKIARVMKKIDPDAPHEVMLVVDATTGQNALYQAVQFHQSIPLTGITLTKLDGTAKGGILFAIADQLKVPIRFIGVGEQIEDLRHFDADEFVNALLSP